MIPQNVKHYIALGLIGLYVGYAGFIGWSLYQQVYQPLWQADITTSSSTKQLIPEQKIKQLLTAMEEKTKQPQLEFDNLPNPFVGTKAESQ